MTITKMAYGINLKEFNLFLINWFFVKIKKLIKYTLLLIVFFKALTSFSLALANNFLCGNEIIDYLIKKDDRNIEYNESRNDAGIHFSYDWNNKDKIIIKRNENNFPIIRYSLFDNKNFKANKTVIRKINDKNLSKLNDEELKDSSPTKQSINTDSM